MKKVSSFRAAAHAAFAFVLTFDDHEIENNWAAGTSQPDNEASNDPQRFLQLRANAFQNKERLTDEELNERIKYFNFNMKGPLYHPDTDLYVMTADGCFASGCEALINAHCLEADIERVCTHSDFRKRGLARAVIQECLYRLKAIGIHNAYITGYSPQALALYGSLGAVDEVKALVYEMPT